MKSEVDEKNLDEEIAKIKDKLSSKIAERQKAQTQANAATRRPQDDHDDLFAEPTGRAISSRDIAELTGTTRPQRSTADDDDFMMIDPKPSNNNTTRKRTVRDASDEDDFAAISPVTTKKRRTAPAKPSAPASRSRQPSVSSNPPPSTQPRRTPARGAASRAKKVPPIYVKC